MEKQLSKIEMEKLEQLNQKVQTYSGGQLQIQDVGQLYRGEIKRIWVKPDLDGGELKVRFAWLKEMGSFRDGVLQEGWSYTPAYNYNASLRLFWCNEYNDRMVFQSRTTGEIAILFPKGVYASRLEGSRKEALKTLRRDRLRMTEER
ncbi:MAG: hypothetical protein ABSD68_01035 [Candidatus Micrarchaeales archaeon]